MDRRTVIAGAAVTLASAALPAIAAVDYSRRALSAQWTGVPHPDPIEHWPEINQTVARAELRRFMDVHPDAKVVAEACECITYGDSRFEPAVRADGSKLEFTLIHTVEFDRPVWDA